MDVMYVLGPVGVALMAVADNRWQAQRIRTWIAAWVTATCVATGAWWYPGLLHGNSNAWLLLVTDLVATTSAWDSVRWGREHPQMKISRYYVWWAGFWASLTIIAVAGNLVTSWLAIEFSSLTSGALIVEMGSRRSLEAAWKYIVIASVGLFMAVIGILFLYASLRAQNLGWRTLDFGNLHAHHASITPIVGQIATILIVSGIGTKAGLVPFHTWLPDAHSEAPSPASGLLSGVLLGLSLVTITKYLSAAVLPPNTMLSGQHLLLVFGALSVVVGTFSLLAQGDVKRLLAYSSIEQIGIAAIGFGINTPLARDAALLQLGFHAVIKSTLFYVSGHLAVAYRTTRLQRMVDMARDHRALAIVWTVGMLALAGLPPLGLAYSEWMILFALWRSHLWVVLAVLSLSLVLGFAALLHHLMRAVWSRDSALHALDDTTPEGRIHPPAISGGGQL